MQRMVRFPAWALLVAAALFLSVACTGTIQSPTPTPTSTATANPDSPCPTIPDQPTTNCPRLMNATLSCGGNGMLHTSVGGGSGSPIQIIAKLDDGSVFSAVLVFVNCQDGPREGVTFGVTYTGEVTTPPTGPSCIRQSKAVFSQFVFGNPLMAPFEGLAKEKLHQALDDEALKEFTKKLSLQASATSRCSIWRQMP